MTAWLEQHRQALVLALRHLAAAPLNTLLAALAVGVALALPAGGKLLLDNALQLARHAAMGPQISVFMARDAAADATGQVAAKLRDNGAIAAVSLVPREQTLARLKAQGNLADVIGTLPSNPFPDAFVVTPKDERPEAMERLRDELARLPRVEHVQLDSAWVRRLDALLRLGRTGLGFLAAMFAVGLVAITFNTVRLQVTTRRAEIEISRLLGATESYIRRPFYYQGALQGILGGLVAWGVVSLGWWQLAGPVADLAKLYAIDFALQPPAADDVAALAGVAGALGWLGAALSLGRHLDA